MGVEITVLLLTWVLPYVIISTIVLQACLLSLPPLTLGMLGAETKEIHLKDKIFSELPLIFI